MAEFNSATELVEASRKTYAEGYRKIDGYSPFPIHELDEALGITRSKLPWIIFLGGLFGGSAGYSLEYWIHVIYYPLNIGGKTITPGAAGALFQANALGTNLPPFVLAALIAMATAMLAGAAFASERRWPGVWRLAGARAGDSVRRLRDGVRHGISRFRS